MRCSKCNKWLPLVTKFCPKCGLAIPPTTKKRAWLNFFGLFFLALLAAFIYPNLFNQMIGGATNPTNTQSNFVPGLILSTLLFSIILFLLISFIKFLIRRPILGVILLVIFIIGPLIAFIFSANSVRKTALSISKIQSNLTDIASAKLAGNAIVSGKKVTDFSLDSIKSTTETASQNLTNISVPSFLQNYQRVAIIWANKIATSTKNTKIWKNIANQPGDFPLILDDDEAQTFFQSSIKIIAELKQIGADAIKNKDKEALRLVAAKLLVQKHWLNGILYSKNSSVAFLNVITPVFASNQDPTQVPDIGPVEDVTCQICSDPKIKWTAQLRAQYGCDTRCNPQQQQTDNIQTPQTQSQTQAQQQQIQSEQNKNNTNNISADDIKKLESYTYKNSPKRAVCIGNNIGGIFCVEDAIQSTNEIAASAIGFADGAKILSVNQWNKEYKNIDDTFSADGTIGTPVSNPSATGGHLEGGMGTISNGEPSTPPKPKKSSSESNKSLDTLGTPPPVLEPIDFSHTGGGLSPAPIIDLEKDTSAQQSK